MERLSPFPKVIKAKDTTLFLEDGREVIDAISSWWCVIHGYNREELNQALYQQANQFSHVMIPGHVKQVYRLPLIDATSQILQLIP